MSNRIDFFQSNQTQLALPAGGVSINLDGELCPFLELLEIVRGGWPEFSWTRLAYNPAAYSGASPTVAEDIETILTIGKRLSVRQVYNSSAPGAAASDLPIFVGQIEAIETEVGLGGEHVEVIATDFSAHLRRITVYGRRVVDLDGSVVFLFGPDTIFNENGKPNATTQQARNNGFSYTVFAADPSQGKNWGYAEVIHYLLCEYVPAGLLKAPGIEQLQAMTDHQQAADLDLTGLNLLQALRNCCERAALKFKFVPRLASTGPESAIVFYKNSVARAVQLNCQPQSQRLSISKTNIAKLHSSKSFWPITHRYIGQGDFKVYEATFELVKAWDPADESNDYSLFSPSSNTEFYKRKDVYRKWCLNEGADYSGSPYDRGDAFDFSKIFDSTQFVHTHRRFWPTLTTSKQGESLGYFLQVSFNDGVTWRQYLNAFNNLLNECGVWLSSDQLDGEIWVAAQKGTLKFRITASVIADERLNCVVADGPVDSVAPVVDHVITLTRQFKYRKVTGYSIFANSSDESLGQANEVDDSAALYEFVRKKALMASETIATIDVQTPYLAFNYDVGDNVTCSPESRDMFGCRDSRSTISIQRVQMDFKNQSTNLKIIRQRLW